MQDGHACSKDGVYKAEHIVGQIPSSDYPIRASRVSYNAGDPPRSLTFTVN